MEPPQKNSRLLASPAMDWQGPAARRAGIVLLLLVCIGLGVAIAGVPSSAGNPKLIVVQVQPTSSTTTTEPETSTSSELSTTSGPATTFGRNTTTTRGKSTATTAHRAPVTTKRTTKPTQPTPTVAPTTSEGPPVSANY